MLPAFVFAPFKIAATFGSKKPLAPAIPLETAPIFIKGAKAY